jgi:hypothetical protein
MISLDWKQRLTQDSLDYLKRKLPNRDYDFDVIYNAYPERIENKVPREVVVLVATTLAAKMTKNPEEFMDFLEYIWINKGENGKVAFSCIMSRIITKKPDQYLEYTKKLIFKSDSVTDINLLLEKVIFTLIKKNPAAYFDTLIQWIREDNELVSVSIVKLIFRIVKNDNDLLKKFFNKMENRWMNASPAFVKVNSLMLKMLAKTDEKFYLSVYDSYKSTREPVFVEILSAALCLYSPNLESYYENWSKSGNARVKKAALSGLKFLLKKKGN